MTLTTRTRLVSGSRNLAQRLKKGWHLYAGQSNGACQTARRR